MKLVCILHEANLYNISIFPKTCWLYLLLEKNLAIAWYTKALEFRNSKSFRRVTEEGYFTREKYGTTQMKPV
jgi:uncharacterized cysteine cluster protein YcgN (CxxCxxCC family)